MTHACGSRTTDRAQHNWPRRILPIIPSRRLLAILGGATAALLGPILLNAIARITLVSFQILVEICHFAVVALRIFGHDNDNAGQTQVELQDA
jgi:hypothetical protein